MEAQSATTSANRKEGNTTSQTTTETITTFNGYAVNNMVDAIKMSESGGNYQAVNGRYYGAYQLDISYLGGDLSPAHQDAVFLAYCNSRYGGITGAWQHWKIYHWY